MAHFAKIENDIVTMVIVAEQDFINLINSYDNELKGEWIKTSYNTIGNVHQLGGEPLRYNYAGIDSIYDRERDAFYGPNPGDGYTLNQDTLLWEKIITE